MDNKHFKGMWKEWGKLTNNDLLEVEGDYNKFLDAVKAWTETRFNEPSERNILKRPARHLLRERR
jgi:hypothetical protein